MLHSNSHDANSVARRGPRIRRARVAATPRAWRQLPLRKTCRPNSLPAGVISADPTGAITGTVGTVENARSLDEAYAAARHCALTQLAVLKRKLGSLNRVAEILTVNGYVNAAPGFPDSPAVIDGASDLFVQIFGEAGRHVRAAIGVSALPRNALVELQMTVRVSES